MWLTWWWSSRFCQHVSVPLSGHSSRTWQLDSRHLNVCCMWKNLWPVTAEQTLLPRGIWECLEILEANVFKQRPRLLLSILQWTRQTLPPNPKQRIIQAKMALVPLIKIPTVEKKVCVKEEVSPSLQFLCFYKLLLAKVCMQLLVVAPQESECKVALRLIESRLK